MKWEDYEERIREMMRHSSKATLARVLTRLLTFPQDLMFTVTGDVIEMIGPVDEQDLAKVIEHIKAKKKAFALHTPTSPVLPPH